MTLYQPTLGILYALPMEMHQRDRDNYLCKDDSGNGFDFTLGAGSGTATIPTKIANRKGYTFDGGDYMQRANPTYSQTAITVFATVRIDRARKGGNCYVASHRSAAVFSWTLDTTGTNLRWICGSTAAASQALKAINDSHYDRLISLTGVYDPLSGSHLYVDGQRQASATTPLPPNDPATVSEALLLGKLYSTTSDMLLGAMYEFRLYNRALSPLEVQSLHYAVKRKLADV